MSSLLAPLLLSFHILGFYSYADDSTLECPSGTELKGALPPKAFTRGCEKSDGTKQGPYEIYDKKTKLLVERGQFKEGSRDGSFEKFYPSGKKMEQGEFSSDQPSGHWTRWYDNGNVKDSGTWIEGNPHGRWRLYYDNGNLQSDGRFEKGQKVCEWKEWASDGRELEPKTHSTSSCSSWVLLQFRAGGLGVVQTTGGYIYTGVISWNPTFEFNRTWSLTGQLGATLYKTTTASMFAVFDYGAMLGFRPESLTPWGLQAGMTLQTWVGTATAPIYLVNVTYALPSKLLGLVSELYLGYGHQVLNGLPNHQIRLGATMSFR